MPSPVTVSCGGLVSSNARLTPNAWPMRLFACLETACHKERLRVKSGNVVRKDHISLVLVLLD